MQFFDVIRVIHWALIATTIALVLLTTMPQLAGHQVSVGRLWYYAMITESGLAITTFSISTRQDSASRGVSLVLTLVWIVNARVAYGNWIKHRDDDDDWPHLKAGRKLRSLLPTGRQPLPTS